MNNLSFRQLTSFLTVLLFVLGGVVSSGIVYLSQKNQQIEASWNSFQEKYSEKARIENSLDSILGYGGMIHEYKNLVLRKDIKNLNKVLSQLGVANILLDKYSNQVINDSELASLKDIRRVLSAYEKATIEIKKAILKGSTSRQIDDLVKLDDTLALRGLRLLRKENVREQALLSDGLSKALLLGEIKAALGFGGMIHFFKNYVLRNDEKDKALAQTALNDALVTIDKYKTTKNITNSEILALEDIAVTVNSYKKGIEKIQALIKQGKSIEFIDKEVRVDDRLAIRGLNIIERQTNQQVKTQADDVSKALVNIRNINQTMLLATLVLVFVVIAINVWVIILHLANPIRRMSEVMQALAQGNVDIKLSSYSGDNDVAQMSRSIEVFRENAIKQIKAEGELKIANEELNSQLNELQQMRSRGDEQTTKALSLAEGLTVARDDAVAATNRAESEKERVRAIVDTVSDSIITIDNKGMIKTFNPASELTFGYRESEVINKNVNILMPVPDSEKHDEYLRRYFETSSGRLISEPGEPGKRREMQAKRKNGDIFPIELSVGVIETAGEKMFTGVVRDISQQKKIEELKQNFVSSVSHELRTPLTAIKGSVGLLASGKLGVELDAQSASLMDVTLRNIDRLSTLINDLLDFEKLEAGSLELNLAPVKVEEILAEAVAVNQHYAANKGVRLVLGQDVDAFVNVDAVRIAQVMANLISNAEKYSPEDEEVVVGAKRKNNMIYFYVSDKGDGVPEEFRDKMFERFTQADGSNQKKKGGTGLGMAISKAIVENHQGKIGFHSEVGKGTEFYFFLPEYKLA